MFAILPLFAAAFAFLVSTKGSNAHILARINDALQDGLRATKNAPKDAALIHQG